MFMLIIHSFEVLQKLNNKNSRLVNKGCKEISIYSVIRDNS